MGQLPNNRTSLLTNVRLRNWIAGGLTFGLLATIAYLFFGIDGTEEIESQSFTNVAIAGTGNGGADLAITGAKDGGFAWGDINQDGFLDLVVNTSNGALGTRILITDGSDPANPTFTDETNTYCQDCANSVKERCALLADINHDGYADLLRNTSFGGIDIYLNRGPAGGYQFGTGSGHLPNKSIQASDFHDGQMNTEGVFLADFDNDGWLDIVVENHNHGIDIFVNPGDGTASFTCLDPAITGLPISATDGDYGTCVDFDDDGDVDIIARKQNENDFFVNGGNGSFSNGQDIDQAKNNNKGAVVFADFDNDGDYDLYWSDNGVNQIWLNDGSSTLAPTAPSGNYGEPWLSAGITSGIPNIDGAAVGDVNNDGKVDLFCAADNGTSYLFINNTPDGGALNFTQNNMGINVNGDGEGCAFADYDNDGDLDLYINVHAGANQLWRNNLNDGNYLFVEPRIDLGGGVYRAALGANVLIEDCQGNVISGIREVPTVAGHGTDAPDQVHFGLPGGPNQLYNVKVSFISAGGSRNVVTKQITPSQVADNKLIIYHNEPNSVGRCADFDQDGVPDLTDLDDDNDGVPDITEIYNGDHDADGTADWEDPDFCSAAFGSTGWDCNDGLPDPSGDLDNDGTPNFADPDFPGCGGLSDGICSAFDRDGDGHADHLDLDSDNDGLPDLVEAGGTDTNGDGQVECAANDTDNDGCCDTYDSFGGSFTGGTSLTPPDKDGDGLPDMLDLDSDNDGIPDLIEAGGIDENGDGRVDILIDTDADGFADEYDPTDNDPESYNDASFSAEANSPLQMTATDTDGNGQANEGYTLGDADGDGLPNYLDLDADNDGIPDLIEAGGVDSDGDGRVDGANPDGTLSADIDNDGFADTIDPDLNNDGDTSDAGDTGVPVALTGADGDGDGRPDDYPLFDNDGSGSTALVTIDADGDGIPNYLDLDADNDGIPDVVEVGLVDSDGDGKIWGLNGDGTFQAGQDEDNDGFLDAVDPDDNRTPTDEDETTQPHIKTVASGTGAADGHPSLADVQGKASLNNGTNADFDGDGFPNYLDLDSDNDGITDLVETFGYTADDDGGEGQDGRVDGYSSNDADSNGWHDTFEGLVPTTNDVSTTETAANTLPDYVTGPGNPDFDGDGLPNYLDIDADGDGIVDMIESQNSSVDAANPFVGLQQPTGVDADYDGLQASFDPDESGTYIQPVNHDGTDLADFLDLDTDNDSVLDELEGHDGNEDGIPDNTASGVDSDQDGLDDAFDTNTNSVDSRDSNQSVQDADNDLNSGGDRDWRDLTGGSFPVEWGGFTGVWEGPAAKLTWLTVSELNSDYFAVERSSDARMFEEIGQVQAAGTTQEAQTYEFKDREAGQLITDRIYYRLRQVDYDGQFAYSSIVELRADGTEAQGFLKVYPNPSSGPLTIDYQVPGVARQIKVSVFSEATGQLVAEETFEGAAGIKRMDFSHLPSGRYYFRLVSDGQNYSARWEKRD